VGKNRQDNIAFQETIIAHQQHHFPFIESKIGKHPQDKISVSGNNYCLPATKIDNRTLKLKMVGIQHSLTTL
jgi:hypothetical protein